MAPGNRSRTGSARPRSMQGYTVYVPYILSVGDWNGQFDDAGIRFGRTALGYAISQAIAVADYVEQRHPSLELVVWGFSYGSQVATFLPHFVPVDELVLSGSMVHDYRASKARYFDDYGLAEGYRTDFASRIDARIDRFAALADTGLDTLVVEMGTGDRRAGMIETVKRLEDRFVRGGDRQFAAITFAGNHATCPSCVLRTLAAWDDAGTRTAAVGGR